MSSRSCQFCGKPVKDPHAKTKFCSPQCVHQWRHEQTKRLCKFCGKPFHSPKPQQQFCSKRCFGLAHVKQTPTFICEICNKTFRKKLPPSRADMRRFCSKRCQYIGLSGENNPQWKGGKATYYGPNWNGQKRKTRKRDQYTCQVCGTTENDIDRELDVHHIIPFNNFGIERYKEANTLDNLVTLCMSCHRTTHNN